MSLPRTESLLVRVQRFLPNLLMGYLLVAVLGWLWMGDPVFSGARPHPYLLLVLWAAIRYGSWEGVVTALTGIVLLLAVGRGSHSETAFLLLATALFTGLMVDANLKRTRRLRLQLARLGSEVLELREDGEVLRASNVDLLTRLEEKDTGLTVIHQVAARLLSLTDPQEIASALVGVAHEFAGAERCSFYRREGAHLRLVLAHGWPTVPTEARVLRPGAEPDLLLLAAERMSVQTVREYPMQARLEPELGPAMPRLLAVPLLHPSSNEVLGVLSIESLPFVRFNTATVQLMLAIAELGSKSLAQARASAPEAHHPAAPAPVLEGDGLLSANLFHTRLRREALARRRGALPPFCVLWIAVDNLAKLGADSQRMVIRAVELVLLVNLRPADTRAQLEPEGFGVLLSDTELATTEALATELSWQLQELIPAWVPAAADLRIQLGWASGEPDTMLERAKERSKLWTSIALAPVG